jgi:hypothetical protein
MEAKKTAVTSNPRSMSGHRSRTHEQEDPPSVFKAVGQLGSVEDPTKIKHTPLMAKGPLQAIPATVVSLQGKDLDF